MVGGRQRIKEGEHVFGGWCVQIIHLLDEGAVLHELEGAEDLRQFSSSL